MYLKSIEIHGFKSFANKIVFEFPEGITGIVGPNGSGKSNVADAVRWVLGEQKIKQLRGSKMEDVIFAGTSTRKPQSYAFVAITLDNSDHKLKVDFDEVTISRRVYRSGESEYLINGSVCRLRDVQEMFYDTGIGKEGYSIIGQGQIDRILQGRPEERREIFDEAVGIVKYKKRKTLAVRKLESERQNLARVSDILSELRRQVGPLKRQSEAAEKFVVFKNELKKYDINLFLFENGDIRAKIKDYQRKEEIAANDLAQAQADLQKTKDEYESISLLLAELEESISRASSDVARCNIVKENLNGQINVINEQIKAAKDARASFNERIDGLKSQLNEALDEKEKIKKEKAENQQKLSESVSLSASRESELLDIRDENDRIAETIESLKEKLIDLTGEEGQVNARIERLNATMEQMKKRKEELKSSLERFSSDKADREQEVKELEKEQKKAASDVDDLKDQIEQKTSSYKELEKNIRDYDDEVIKAKEKLLKDQAALESLKNITERYEGYGNTIKAVMKLKDTNKGIHGVVADIIRTEKEYEVAIETALGGSIQNIVTDTENTAKDIIEYLKKNQLGRATFLPLKAISGRGDFKNPEVLDEEGVIGLASSLVNVEDQYKGVASYLLGRIVVIDNLTNAIKVARKYKYSLIIVTLEGELLNRGGSLTGGAYKNKSNLLGRRREMEELERSIGSYEEKQKDLVEKTDAAKKSLGQLLSDIEVLRRELQEHLIYLNTVKINLDAAKKRTAEIEDSYQNVDIENKLINEQESTIKDENTTLEKQLADTREENESVKEKIVILEKDLEKGRKKEAEKQLLAQTLRVETSRLNEQNTFLSNSAERIDNTVRKLKSDIDALINSNDDSGQLIANKEKEIGEIQLVIDKAEAQLREQTALVAELEKQKEEKTGSHKEFINKREEYAKRSADLDKELFRLTSMREKLEERFENKANYIWDEYQLTYNNALELRDDELNDAREMRAKISELKSSIRGLGTINVGAIEEYKEVKERFEFLSGQHDDLVKAEADLIKIIRDLDREMRRQFNEEFKKIRAEFARVFKQMFGGGYGSIEIEEDMDVLEAGISIIAQPPGKKLQNMMQLSGGEKALTAIALLFAIQNLKPSPFCILDEIEAALDDSNIIRFADYLKKLTKETQFIVITHRKGTMEAADRLYGITMQERGVSSLISVDLSDYKDEETA